MKLPPGLLAALAAPLFRLWARSIVFDAPRIEILREMAARKEPAIVAIWHQDLFSLIASAYAHDYLLVTAASDSRDGEIIAKTLEKIGFVVGRGSSTRGGVKAMLRMIKTMQQLGRAGALTIDGPKGPRHKAKDGIIALAQRTGAWIIPARAYPDRRHVFEKSWDHFILPMPFCRCRVVIADPYRIGEGDLDADRLEAERAKLEGVLESLT